MKKITTYIQEKLIVNNTIQGYKYYPKNKYELVDIIQQKIDTEGLGTPNKPLNLNDINTSNITHLGGVFCDTTYDKFSILTRNGCFDISGWDVSNVTNMDSLFYGSNFNGDLSSWDVSKVENMENMFRESKFTGENGDISNWDVSKVENMSNMFAGSHFNGDISNWDVSKVKNMRLMFIDSKFKGDINNWNVESLTEMNYMFDRSPLEKNPPKWYKR